MHRLIADVPISRRLRLNYVINNCAEVAYTSKSTADCIQWILDRGETEFIFSAADREPIKLCLSGRAL